MADRIVAIHQPNFFPWLGYFDKIARSHVFVLLDDVQFEKSGSGTWCNRVRLLVNGAPMWATLPVRRDFHGVRQVNEIEIDNRQPFREKLLKTLRSHYAAAPFFRDVAPFVEPLVLNPAGSLVEYNVSAIRAICEVLRLDTGRLVLASTLAGAGQATDRLIALVRAVGGTAYLSGGGAGGYQEDAKFAAAGVELVYQNFQHPHYRQSRAREFVAGLSILDALFHCGFDGTAALVG